jgi:type I restriction enzyme S subunit
MEQALDLEIPLPPLAEQKRIVTLLDEAFAGIDEAKAKAESNAQAAADFLESRLSELFLKPEETPSMISDHCTDVTVGYVGPMADKYVPKGIPFLRSQNVRPFEINFENLMQITPAFEKSLSKSRLAPGDVVVVRTGYPGTAAVIPAELPIANCADLVILRPMKSLDPNDLVAFFNSKVGKDMVLGRLVGAAQKHFNVGAAKSVLLPIPTIQRQREVVSHIFEIRTHVGKLMDNSKAKLSELSELKASILAQAFAGELTA